MGSVSQRALTDSDFDAAIGVAGVVLVHFTAAWCQPCGRAVPAVAALADDLRPGKGRAGVAVMAADVDAAPQAAARADVRLVPCLVMFRDGVRIASLVGFYPREKLLGWVEEELKGEK